MGTRPKRTDDELREASGHLMYEMDMLMATSDLLSTGQYADTPLGYALLDSFVAHARALLHCFYPSGRKDDDDVLAADFFDNATEWECIRPELPTDLERVRGRANKEVAHLTYTRTSIIGDTKGWPFVTIAKAFQPTFKAFAHNVPSIRLCGQRGWELI